MVTRRILGITFTGSASTGVCLFTRSAMVFSYAPSSQEFLSLSAQDRNRFIEEGLALQREGATSQPPGPKMEQPPVAVD